jgi:hypothetical protein
MPTMDGPRRTDVNIVKNEVMIISTALDSQMKIKKNYEKTEEKEKISSCT